MWEVYAPRYAKPGGTARENFLRPPDPHDVPVPEALCAVATDSPAMRDVILAHLHYDHAGQLGLFAHASAASATPSKSRAS